MRPRCSRTASIIDTQDFQSEVVRRGEGIWESTVSACTSATSGRRPSRVTVRQVPGTGSARRVRKRPLGSARPVMPSSCSSKQPTSSVAP
ncbi:hypothetical protein SFUMM280S_00789 [Streptomyces fumanus]